MEREVYDDFVSLLKEKTEKIKVGNPIERDVFLGPVVNEEAMNTFEQAAGEAKKNGNVITGGERITEGDLARGLFVQPTVVEAPEDSWLWKKELFVPFVAVAPFDELDDAIDKANDTEYGLTAGFFSKDRHEIEEWLDKIQAGVVYVNRRPGRPPAPGRASSRSEAGRGRDDRQGRRWPLLRVAVPAGAVPDGDRGVRQPEGLAGRKPQAAHGAAGAEGPGSPRTDARTTSPSLPRAYPFVPARGAGSVVEDVDGNVFLDVNAGIAVTSTGHCHPTVVEAIQRQAAELIHYSASDFYLPIYSELTERLAETAPMPNARSFLTNSGTEAVEAGISSLGGRPDAST